MAGVPTIHVAGASEAWEATGNQIPDAPNVIHHVTLSWEPDEAGTLFSLYLNGAPAATLHVAPAVTPAGIDTLLSWQGAARLHDAVYETLPVTWLTAMPQGHVRTRTSELDLMDHGRAGGLPFGWRATSGAARYEDHALRATGEGGLVRLYHPAAFGLRAGMEATLRFESDSAAGVFLGGSAPEEELFSGYAACLKAGSSEVHLLRFEEGEPALLREFEMDHVIRPGVRYTLNLAHDGDHLRVFLDGHAVIAHPAVSPLIPAYAGLWHDGAPIAFNAMHFSALTPSTEASRLVSLRTFQTPPRVFDTASGPVRISVRDVDTAAVPFQWMVRRGVKPEWKRSEISDRTEPTGSLFGPSLDGVTRPNPPAAWRAQDSANSDVLVHDGRIYYNMRGNPLARRPSRIGMLTLDRDRFDGLRFPDPTQEELAPQLLLANDGLCPGSQINDQGTVWLPPNRMLLMCRQTGRGRSRALVYGLYDMTSGKWTPQQAFTVPWSQMDPECAGAMPWYNGTPELVAVRHPETNELVIYLYHEWPDAEDAPRYDTKITPMRFDEREGLMLTGPARGIGVHNADWSDRHRRTFGFRVFFDNGIYYMHFNAASLPRGIFRDWPDVFRLASALSPEGPWVISEASVARSEPYYFERGKPYDFDNGAIWHGSVLKLDGRYYMYYEFMHTIFQDVDHSYLDWRGEYGLPETGSRVGLAIAN